MKDRRSFIRMVSVGMLVLVVSLVHADRPAPERKYTVTSPNGTHEFTMHPTIHSSTSTTSPYGEAFRVSLDGEPRIETAALWRVDGWYSFETFIADDGRGLIRFGPWASKPPNEELAIAFYRDGQELWRYFVADLIDDSDSVQRSVSHYMWQKREQGYPRLTLDNYFELLTVEDQVITFDVETGELQGDGRKDVPELEQD
jgi:hypothetical protein